MPFLTLNTGQRAVVDIDDWFRLWKYDWQEHKVRQLTYAVRYFIRKGKRKRVYLHRSIVRTTKQVHHKDGDGLNCRRSNLVPATNAQNHWSHKKPKLPSCASRYRGVWFHGQNKNWCAEIKKNYQKKHLGSFSSEVDAARAYDKAAKRLFGKWAHLNFPKRVLS